VTSPVAATIDATGISAPSYAQILAYYIGQFQLINGADSYLGNDSQDGQLLGIFAQGISDCNSAIIAAYNSFSPTTALDAALSSNVKLNGLARILGSFSSAALTVVGQANTVITNGQAQDQNGNLWAIPSPTTIPVGGSIVVVGVCTTLGAIAAPANTINIIGTPTLGWQTVNNAAPATPGNPVENNAQLRIRQASSVALPSVTVFSGIVAAIRQVPGVTRITPYENNTNSTDGNGIPKTTLCFVIEGGAQSAIINAIASKMPPGTATFGNVSGSYTDSSGVTRLINYQTPSPVSSFAATIGVHTLNGWADSTIVLIQAAVSSYLTTLPIGGVVNIAAITAIAQLLGTLQAPTFLVKTVQVSKNGGGLQSTDFTLGFSESANPGTHTVNKV